MVRLRVRPRPRNRDSPDVSFESTGTDSFLNSSRLTVDTSSLTSSSHESGSRQLPPSPIKDEVNKLRRRIKSHEKREAQLTNDIAFIQQKLEFSKKSVNQLKQVMNSDVRPGAHYRKEIVLLRQELDKKDDDIRDREVTIENLMAGNHPRHAFTVDPSQQTSVCSSLLEETLDISQAREMERLLSENMEFAHKLRKQEEENSRLRITLAQREKDQIEMKQRIADYERNKSRSLPFNPFQMADGPLAITCDSGSASNAPAITCDSGSASIAADRSELIRTKKRMTELHNELNKTKKERSALRHELEQSRRESKSLRRQLTDAKSQSANNKNELVSKLNEVKLALDKSGRKEVTFASGVKNGAKDEMEIRSLKKALEEALAELEMAAEVMMQQRQTIEELKSTLEAKEADYSQLQRCLQLETESLEITKSYLKKKDSEIEMLTRNAKNKEVAENNAMHKDDEIKGLQKTMTFWKERCNDLQKEVAEKEVEIDRLMISSLKAQDNLVEERRTQVQSEDDGPHLFSSLKKENELLLEKTRSQMVQLQKSDKILIEKELEKSKLKTLLAEMQSKLGIIDSSFLSSNDEKEADEDSVLMLQTTIGSLTAQTKDQQSEMDMLVKKFAQLAASNRALERKCNSFEQNGKFFTDEIDRLHNDLIRENCQVEPFKNYVKMLVDRQMLEDGSVVTSSTTMNKLESSRLELLNWLNNTDEERQVLQRSLDLKDEELEKLLYLKDDKGLEAERNEKEEITQQRNIIFMKLKDTRKDLHDMEEKNKHLEKVLMSQASSLQSLSDKNGEKDTEMAKLKRSAAIGNSLISENADLKEQNALYMERVDILLLEIEELKQEVSSHSTTNESFNALKSKLEQAKHTSHNLKRSYEERFEALAVEKDAVIRSVRQDLTALQCQSSAKIARLEDELSKLRGEHSDMEARSMKVKDERIEALEQTLHNQEKIVVSLRAELRQAERGIQNPSQYRRKELEGLQRELIECKASALAKDREFTYLQDKLHECKIEHEEETEFLEKEIERLNNEREVEDNGLMLAAKQRLEQLRVVNVELKEDNEKLGVHLEQALAKIEEMESKKGGDLETIIAKDNSAVKKQTQKKVAVAASSTTKIGKGTTRSEKPPRSKRMGWGKKSSVVRA